MIEKYGKVIISENDIVATEFIFNLEVNHRELLYWAIERILEELAEIEQVGTDNAIEPDNGTKKGD